MNIGEAARRSGLPTKTIRYYEEIGLVSSARRDNGFRDYDEKDVHNLRFVARARGLGFTVEECRHLLELYKDPARSSAEVRRAAERHVDGVRAKIAELQAMEKTLHHLIHACAGDGRPDCPILEGLAGD
ncbi:MAG: Cu(I)-responsive transcriptional regulator [Pseudomonadota bacterium]|nr:Cu(I)-responsive transcriptional regulator [Pseudomonadota bacterium]